MCTLCDVLYVYVSIFVSAKTVILLIQYPSFPAVFSSGSGVLVKTFSTAVPRRFSLMSVFVFGSCSTGPGSFNLCVSGGHAVKHPGKHQMIEKSAM